MQLKKELLDVIRHMSAFTEHQSERCGRALVFLSQQWVKNNGPVENCKIELRKAMASEFMKEARQRYEIDQAASFGFAVFALHLESGCLPGDDAKFAFVMTSKAIKDASDLLEKLEGNPPSRSGEKE